MKDVEDTFRVLPWILKTEIVLSLSRQLKTTPSTTTWKHPELARHEIYPLPVTSMAPSGAPLMYNEHGKKLVQSATPVDTVFVQFLLSKRISQSKKNTSQFGQPAVGHVTSLGIVTPCKSCNWPAWQNWSDLKQLVWARAKRAHVCAYHAIAGSKQLVWADAKRAHVCAYQATSAYLMIRKQRILSCLNRTQQKKESDWLRHILAKMQFMYMRKLLPLDVQILNFLCWNYEHTLLIYADLMSRFSFKNNFCLLVTWERTVKTTYHSHLLRL